MEKRLKIAGPSPLEATEFLTFETETKTFMLNTKQHQVRTRYLQPSEK
jgi:hypothetical protein